MKVTIIWIIRLFAVLASYFLITGCGPTIHIIKCSEIKELQTGSPLKSVSPKIFAFRGITDDNVGEGDDYIIARSKDGTTLAFDQSMSALVIMLIKKELERNGHKWVQDLSTSNADFIIKGTINKFKLTTNTNANNTKATADVAVELTISSMSDDKRVLTKKYKGQYALSANYMGITEADAAKECENIIIRALMMMVGELSTDQELVDFIGK